MKFTRILYVIVKEFGSYPRRHFVAGRGTTEVEWAIMDRFSETLKDAQTCNDFHAGIRGLGAFRLFKHLLTEYNLWDAWNQFKQVKLRQMAIEWCEENRIRFHQI